MSKNGSEAVVDEKLLTLSLEELRRKRDEYNQAAAVFEQQADQNMKLAVLNRGAASAMEAMMKELEGAEESAPDPGKGAQQCAPT